MATSKIYSKLQRKLDGKSYIFGILSFLCIILFVGSIATIPPGGVDILRERKPIIFLLITLMTLFFLLQKIAVFQKHKESRWEIVRWISRKDSPGEESIGLNVLLVATCIMLYNFVRTLIL